VTKDTQDYPERQNLWDEQWPDTEPSAHTKTELDTEDELSPFPETVGTHDVIESVRDAEPYEAPIDPPVLPGGREGVHVATGFGVDAEEEAAQDASPRGDDDVREEALLTLRQDSLTSKYRLDVTVHRGVVRLTGRVPSVEDAEHATWVLGELAGVVNVVDDTTLDPGVE
jgi:hypothetical protein